MGDLASILPQNSMITTTSFHHCVPPGADELPPIPCRAHVPRENGGGYPR